MGGARRGSVQSIWSNAPRGGLDKGIHHDCSRLTKQKAFRLPNLKESDVMREMGGGEGEIGMREARGRQAETDGDGSKWTEQNFGWMRDQILGLLGFGIGEGDRD